MDKKISVKKFVDEYNKLSYEKCEKYVKSIVVDRYVSYEEKIRYCNKIIEISSYKKEIIDGVEKKYIHFDSTVSYMFYTLTLVKLYTSLDINFGEALEQFNLLNGGKNALDMIVRHIPEREIKEMQMIMGFISDDFERNECSIPAIIKKYVNKTSLLSENFLSTFIEEIVKNIDINEFKNLIRK